MAERAMDSLERRTLTELLAKQGADAWPVLRANGWLEALPEADGTWPLAEIAALVADVTARGGHELSAGAHLAAAATLVENGHGGEGDRLAVFMGRGRDEGRLLGRLWGDPAADLIVVALDGLGVAAGPVVTCTPDNVLVLRGAGVHEATIEASAVKSLSADAGLRARHDARVAWLLGVEAMAAVAEATERTLAYTQKREAFGRPLSAQQSLQHILVEMRTVDLLGGALVRRATASWADGDPLGVSWAAGMFAGTRAVWAAEHAIQLHGGVGFTWELGLRRPLALAQRARLLLGADLPARALMAAAAAERDVELKDWSIRFTSSVG